MKEVAYVTKNHTQMKLKIKINCFQKEHQMWSEAVSGQKASISPELEQPETKALKHMLKVTNC